MKTDAGWVWVPFEVDKKFEGYRIDRFLAQRLKGYSRSKVQGILAEARVLKEERPAKAHGKVRAGDKIQVSYPRKDEKPLAPGVSLPVLYEDDDLLLIHKPAHLLSHPTDKVVHNTVLGVLRHTRPNLESLHLLHRLDRETSGIMSLAKNSRAARLWAKAMMRHEIRKEYIAFVRGVLSPSEGVMDWPIGAEGGPIRVRQAIHGLGASPARTRYVLLKSWGQIRFSSNGASKLDLTPGVSMVRVFPQTGRMHQIRVHMAALGHPLLGDPLYTGEGEIYLKLVAGRCTPADRSTLGFPRVALHAATLSFLHPMTQSPMRIEAPLPEDMQRYLRDLSVLNESQATVESRR